MTRSLGRPGFVAACVVTLALGIGASTTVFSVLNAVVLRPMPFGDASSLVYVWAPHRLLPDLPVNTLGPSPADFFELERDARLVSAMAYFDVETFGVTSGGVTDRLSGARVSSDFFSTMQAQAARGRTVEPGDDQTGRGDVVVISHRLWQRAFAASPSAVGRSLTIDRRQHRVIGVMPPSFLYPRAEDLYGEVESNGSDLWLPQFITTEQRASRDFSDNVTIARLAPGASIGAAESELRELMARLDPTREADMQGWSIALRSLVESSVGEARAPMWMLFGAVAFVLLIACSNVAHLLLTRAGDRAREMAIRSALGASRWQMTRRALGESMTLAACGGLFGVLIAYGAVRILVGINPGNIPRLAEASIDGRVLLFGVALSALTGLLLGLVPARWAAGAAAGDLLRTQAGHASVAGRRLRWSLVAGEVALAMVLMSGAGLLLRSYAAVQRVEPGFSTSSVMLAVYLDDRYDSPETQRRVFQSLLAEVRTIPGVKASGIVDALPFSKTQRLSRFEVDGIANEPDQLVHSRMATPEYFDAIGTPLVDGRAFRESDAREPSTAMLVNEAFARRYFPDQRAVGRRVRFRNQEGAAQDLWSTIVGIVADVRHTSVEEPAVPQVYSPWNGTTNRAYLVVSSAVEAAAVIASVRSAARAVDPMLPLDRLGSMSDLVNAANARRRFQTSVIAASAIGAWLLAALGLYGLIVHAVQQRMTEIGIRIALGAQARDVMRLIMGQGMGLTAAGLVIGGLAAVLLTRVVQAWLFQVSPGDRVAFGLSGAALLVAALVACYLPARRATRADVVKVLRAE